MMVNFTMDRPWAEQTDEVKNAIDEVTYNKVAEVLGIKLESRKSFFEKVLTSIAKRGILRP